MSANSPQDPHNDFWATPTFADITEQQGKKPIMDPHTLHGNFWPEDEAIEQFLAFLDESRGRKKHNPAA